jgi:hypothetical protein
MKRLSCSYRCCGDCARDRLCLCAVGFCDRQCAGQLADAQARLDDNARAAAEELLVMTRARDCALLNEAEASRLLLQPLRRAMLLAFSRFRDSLSSTFCACA